MRRLGFGALALLLAALTLGACGDPEPEQRKAFIGFLQTRILDKPGLHVPRLTPDETKAFGPYAEHWAVIARFHEGMNASVSPKLQAAVAKGAIRSLDELIGRRDDLRTAKTTLNEMNAALDGIVVAADAGHGALKQPDDLKAVYDGAYERLVAVPTATFRGVVPVADTAFSQALELADYLDRNKAKVTISGATVQVKDRKLLEELNGKIDGLKTEQTALQAAQQRFQTMLRGPG